MIWRDILIDRRPEDRELRDSLASLFGINPIDVTLFGDYSQLLQPMLDRTRVICERLPTAGEFKMKLGIMPIHPDQEALARRNDDLELLSTLCQTLAVRGLIDDGSVNPFAFLLLDRDGSVSHVALNADQLDLNDTYVLLPQVVEDGTGSPC